VIRVNLRIQEAVSPLLHEAMTSVPVQARAERLRALATIGLQFETDATGSGNRARRPTQGKSDGLEDADIAKIFGGPS